MKVAAVVALLFVISSAASRTELPLKEVIKLPPDNPMATLKPGPGLETVQAYCGICHSTDYIVRQPRKDASAWQAEVAKMVSAYGASIPKEQEAVIVRYLSATYGQEASEIHPGGKAR